jgi:hypothetical protein
MNHILKDLVNGISMTIWKFEGKNAVKITGKEIAPVSQDRLEEGKIMGLHDSIEAADAAISSEDYVTAMKRYRVLLSRGVGSNLLLQRIADLKWFVRLKGKDKDLLILLLEDFGLAIRHRYEKRKAAR